jgi:hypothetical protein
MMTFQLFYRSTMTSLFPYLPVNSLKGSSPFSSAFTKAADMLYSFYRMIMLLSR